MLRRVPDLCFLKMPVNKIQYRVTVGIFNNRKLITNLRFELLQCSKLSNNLLNYDASFLFPIVLHFSHCISVFKGLCFKNQQKIIYFNFPVFFFFLSFFSFLKLFTIQKIKLKFTNKRKIKKKKNKNLPPNFAVPQVNEKQHPPTPSCSLLHSLPTPLS